MSLYSPSKNFLFTHVPKTGGTSMHRWLTANIPDAEYLTYEHKGDAGCHLYCMGSFRIMGAEKWRDAWKFAFVRSPYTWVESLRRYALLRPEGARYAKASDNLVSWVEDLYERCTAMEHTPNGPMMLQHLWVHGCDSVFRFEDLADRVGYIAHELGIDAAAFPHANFNGQPEQPIDGEYREAIAHYFKEDFEALGYEV